MLMETNGLRCKRPHSEVEDCDECSPISKRINRLHIQAQRKSQCEEQSPSVQQMQQMCSLHVNNNSLNPEMLHNAYTNPGQLSEPFQVQQQQYQAMPQMSLHPHMSAAPQAHTDPGMSSMHQMLQSREGGSQGVSMQPVAIIDNSHAHYQPSSPPARQEEGIEYEPELTEVENPYYFRINHVLYEAHCERLRRGGFPVDQDPESFS